MINKHIENLVNSIMLTEKQNYEKNFHSRFKPDFQYSIYERFYSIDNSMIDSVNEEYHIQTLFDEVLNKIEELYIQNKNDNLTQVYTGYALKYKDTSPEVIYIQEPTKECYPIYIKIIYEPETNVYAAVQEQRKPIVIEINSYKIEDDINLLRSACKHEFLHIREKYAKENIDVLQNKKNLVPQNLDKVFLWDRDFRYEYNAASFCNIVQPSEIRARINAFSEYIKYRTFESFNECLEQTNEVTQFFDIFKIIKTLDLFNKTNNYSALEVYMYYCQKYSIVHTKYKSFSFSYRKPISQYTEDEIDLMEAFILELQQLIVVARILVGFFPSFLCMARIYSIRNWC